MRRSDIPREHFFPLWVRNAGLMILLAALIALSIYGAAVVDPMVEPLRP